MSANPRHHNVNVSGSVYYALAPDGRLFHYADTPPSGAVETNIEFVEHVVEISDVRWSVQAPRLDVEGATLSTYRSAVRNFYDADELLRVGYPEVADLVRTLSGAAGLQRRALGRAESSHRSRTSTRISPASQRSRD